MLSASVSKFKYKMHAKGSISNVPKQYIQNSFHWIIMGER